MESVDSISRDDPDTPIYVTHYKKSNISEQITYDTFLLSQSDFGQIPHLSIPRTFKRTLALVRTRHVEKLQIVHLFSDINFFRVPQNSLYFSE